MKILEHYPTRKLQIQNIFFRENLMENMNEAKKSLRISNSLVNNSTTKFQIVSYQSGTKLSFGYINSGSGTRFFASHSLNFQGRKRNHQH